MRLELLKKWDVVGVALSMRRCRGVIGGVGKNSGDRRVLKEIGRAHV